MSETHSFDVRGVKVAIGVPNYGVVTPQTASSLAATAHECGKIGIGLDFIFVQSVLPWSRDNVVDEFLKLHTPKLFWIDSDMVWEPKDFIRLVALSTVRDVIGAAYPAKVEGPITFYAAYDGSMRSEEYGLLRVKGMGLGFTIMDRAVVQRVAEKAPILDDPLQGKKIRSVFRFGSVNGQRQGEDMAFFEDVRTAGYTVWMDPSIELGHVGMKQWRGRIADAMQSAETEIVGPNKERAA